MATEIEYKFLVNAELFLSQVVTASISASRIHQGYMSSDPTIRVRVSSNGQGRFAWMTVKGKRSGLSRKEYEFQIPVDDAIEMMNLCYATVNKTRYYVEHKGNTWEVDVFEGENEGLIVAELEVPHEGYEFIKPSWVTVDVSKVSKYTNSNLAKKPFKSWN